MRIQVLPLVALASFTAPSMAQEFAAGLSVGPFGGSFYQVAIDPSGPGTVLVSSIDDGLIASNDNGMTYSSVGSGLPESTFNGFVRALEDDPNAGGRWLAGFSNQIFESLDDGATFQPTAFVGDGDVRHIVASPDGDSWFVATTTSVYLSTDDGQSWNLVVSDSIQSAPHWSISEPGTAWVGTFNGPLKSTDGGQTFANPSTDTSWVRAVVADATTPGTVYIGGFASVKKSTDGGATFTDLTSPVNSSVKFMRVDPFQNGRIWLAYLADLYFSDNGGQSWVNAGGDLPPTQPIITDLEFTGSGDRFLTTESGGIFRSLASEQGWTLVGLPQVELWDVAVTEPGGQRVYTNGKGTFVGEGPFGFVDTGEWNADFGARTNEVLVDPNDPDRWILGGVGAFFDNATIRVLTNNGLAVETPVEAFGTGEVLDLAMNPSQPNEMIASFFPLAFGGFGLMQSSDTGATWTDVASTGGVPFTAAEIDPFDGDHWLALNPMQFGGGTLYETTDGGQTMLPAGVLPGSGFPHRLAFDPLRQGIVYHLDDVDGLWRSTDGGQSWSGIAANLGEHSDIEFHPTVPGVFWLSNQLGQLLVTGDGGDSFVSAWSTPLDNALHGIALDPGTNTIVAATNFESAYEVVGANPFNLLGGGSSGVAGIPSLIAEGGLARLGNAGFGLALEGAAPSAIGAIYLGLSDLNLPLFGGVLHTGTPLVLEAGGLTDPQGRFAVPAPVPATPTLLGLQLFAQGFAVDGAASGGIALSDGLGVRLLP